MVGAAQSVAFPLRFYSFEEIAQRMSVGVYGVKKSLQDGCKVLVLMEG